MIYRFEVRGKVKATCGPSRYEEAHSYMSNKFGQSNDKVFAVESTKAEEIKASADFKKLLNK